MNELLGGDNLILLVLLLFVFLGGDTFDTTQLLLALALFSTLMDNGACSGRFTTENTFQNLI